METTVIRKALINTLAADGGNVKNDSASGAYRGACIICELDTASPIVNYLPPIAKGACKSAVKLASAAEVSQLAVIGFDVETIVAATRYKIEIGSNQETYEGQTRGMFRYAYTSPTILSGNAETDRANVYATLVTKINNHVDNKVTAYALYKVAFTSGATALPVVGETVTQTTSNVTAKIAAVEITSGNFNGGTAAGTIWLYNFSAVASWSAASKTLTGTSTAVVTTNAALTTGAGIAILDDAGYYGAAPNSKRGPSWVSCPEGFATAHVEIGTATAVITTTGILAGRAAVISQGIGTRMLLDVPTFTPSKEVLVSGNAGFILNMAPIAGYTYTTVIMVVDEAPSDTNITGYGKQAPVNYIVWVSEGDGTNLTNFLSELATALGVTIT